MQLVLRAWWSGKTSITGTKTDQAFSYKISGKATKSLNCAKPVYTSPCVLGGENMKVFLCLCTLIAAASAGYIGYPVTPISYPSSYYISPPLTTVARPLGVTYTGFHGYPLPLAPSYFSYNVIPNNVFFTGLPGVVQYLPVAPADGKGKPGKKPGKKPGNKKEDKDTKEDTTEEPKQEEEGVTKTDETEDLAQ